MAFADDILPTLAAIRAIPGQFGLRQHSVEIVTVFLQGTHTGDGARAEASVSITESGGQNPKVRWAKSEDVAMGLIPKGFVTVGPITPEFVGGGTTLSDLTGSELTPGEVRLMRITGPQHPEGADYTIIDVKAEKALNYIITGIPVSSASP